VSYIENSCSSPWLFQQSMSSAQQLMLIYNNTVYKNKVYIAINVAKTFEDMKDQHVTMAVKNL